MSRLQVFFGDDWDDALDSVKSAPGALGGLALTALRQVRPVDALAFALVIAGWAWLAAGYPGIASPGYWQLSLALLPTLLWLACGLAGGLIFEISGLGYRVLAYWEAYVLIVLFALFGVAALRLALTPHGRRIYRGPASSGQQG